MKLCWWASIILVLVFLAQAPYSIDAYPVETETSLKSSEIYTSRELLTDPTLKMEPEYYSQGPSREFSFEYTSPSAENDGGVVTLNWTHVPGTELEFDTSGITPDCQEFVYFSQNFTWNLNTIPSSLNLSLRYQISRTGRFLTQYSTGLFEIRFWFIHPEGFWQEITRFGGIQDFYRSNSHTIQRLHFSDLFEKLTIGSDYGQRPAAQLAVGLVPTWRFMESNGMQLWREFNGSVILDITEMRLSALHRRADTSVDVETPSFNNSWYAGNSDPFRDSFMASDDSFYVLSVEDLPDSGFGSTLTRVGLRGDEVWSRTWSTTDRLLGHSVAATPDKIYVIGTMYGPWVTSNVGLHALDVNGNDLWNRTLDYSASDYPGDVGVNSEGEIFVGVSTVLAPVRNVLMKFDSTGEKLWERNFGATQWDRVYDVEVCENGNVYTRTENLLSLWDDDGNSIWNITGYFDDAYVLENGNVLSINQAAYGAVNLTCYNMDGEKEWSSLQGIHYTHDWWDYVTITSAIDGPNETIFALLWIYGYHPGRLLLQLDSNGHQLLNRTLSFSENLYATYDILQYIDMYMDSNGLLYFVGEHVSRNFDNSIVIGVYDFNGAFSDMTNSVLTNSFIGFVLVTVVMVSYEVKRRTQYSG